MSSDKKEEVEVELVESNFTFHDFTDSVGEVSYTCQIMKMEESFYVYIGKAGEEEMSNLNYAFLSTYDNLPVSTRLMGAVDNPLASSLTSQLTQLCGKPVYVSLNLKVTRPIMPSIAKRVAGEFKEHALAP